jgi:hypothetical protein
MTGVPVRVLEQIVLVLGFRFPEIAGGCHFCHDLARPEA